jgi:hypothetical protein
MAAGCRVLKSHSSAKRAVPEAPISGRTSIGTKSVLQVDPPAPSHAGQSRIKRDEPAGEAILPAPADCAKRPDLSYRPARPAAT